MTKAAEADARILISELSLHGSWCCAALRGGEYATFFVPHAPLGDAEGEPEAVGSSKFNDRILAQRPDLPPTKAKLKPYREEALRVAYRDGVRAEAETFATEVRGALRVHIGRGVVVELAAGCGPQVVPNTGEDGSIMLPSTKLAPIAWSEIAQVWPSISCGFAGFRQCFLDHLPSDMAHNLTGDEQAAILLSWWLGIFLAPVCRGRPVLALTGAWGSGKSAQGRMLGLAFYGQGYDVATGVSADRATKDLAAAVSMQPIVIRDDLNDAPDEITDLICSIATGSKAELSAFHETLSVVEYQLRASLAITAIRPSWALREDLLSRLLVLRLGKPSSYAGMTLKERESIVLRSRAWIWAETIAALSAAQNLPSAAPIGETVTRFDDWERWVRRAAYAGGWLGSFESALAKMPRQVVALAAGADPFLASLEALASAPGVADRVYTAAQLYAAMTIGYGAKFGVDPSHNPETIAARNPRALGQFLARMERQGSSVAIVERAGKLENQMLWRIRPKE